MKNEITFNDLPDAISQLILKVEALDYWVKNNSNRKEEAVLSIDQAAEFLNLSKPTIYSKVSKNEIPFIKKSKRLYFIKEELFDYLNTGRNTTAKDVDNDVENFLESRRK